MERYIQLLEREDHKVHSPIVFFIAVAFGGRIFGLLAEIILYLVCSIVLHELMHLIAVMLLEPEKLQGFVLGLCKYGVIMGVHLSRRAERLISYLAPQLLNLFFLMLPMWLAIPLILANVGGGMLDLYSMLRKGKEARFTVYGVYIRRDLSVLVGKF